MANNFYVGVVYHGKRLFKQAYSEKIVLYSENNIDYLDLINNIWYSIDNFVKDYVDIASLISTDVSIYKEDYLYLLSKYKSKSLTKKKRLNFK